MSVWSDTDIVAGISKGDIRISPLDSDAIQPASVDLRLGSKFFRFLEFYDQELDEPELVIDPAKPVNDLMREVPVTDGFVLLDTGNFILGATVEKISLGNNVVGRIEGKSSLARLGLSVHSTGGFIDPGNQDLNITLEITNHSPLPIRLYPGMWIAQIAFEYTLSPCTVPYGKARGSRYFADSEPIPSRVSEKLR